MLGVRMKGESGSEEMDVRGRELIMALASARKVVLELNVLSSYYSEYGVSPRSFAPTRHPYVMHGEG